MRATLVRLTAATIWVLSPALMGCAAQSGQRSDEAERYSARPSRPPRLADARGPAMFLPVPEGAPPEALRWAIEAALSERHWNVARRRLGLIEASVSSHGSGEMATIEIAYGPRGIDITSVWGTATPRRYDRWMRLLAGNINAHVAQIGMGRRAAPWEQTATPPAAAPPPAAPPPAQAPPDEPERPSD